MFIKLKQYTLPWVSYMPSKTFFFLYNVLQKLMSLCIYLLLTNLCFSTPIIGLSSWYTVYSIIYCFFTLQLRYISVPEKDSNFVMTLDIFLRTIYSYFEAFQQKTNEYRNHEWIHNVFWNWIQVCFLFILVLLWDEFHSFLIA